MAEYCLCLLLVFLNIVDGNILKGLYCQDPDSGKLYPINATWPSETFCGNYTCKLRKKNLTETEYTPITKVNITHLLDIKGNTGSDMSTSQSENSLVVIKKIERPPQAVLHRQTFNKMDETKDNLKINNLENNDRYLSESEIKTITKILHTVKKSDLDAIVEIYNLAQEIYKEMDGSTNTDKLGKETMRSMKSDKGIKKSIGKGKDSISYWYEPLSPSNTKIKPTDLKIEGSNFVPTTKAYAHPASYFNGPLTEKDFRKLPYYYPMSNFQRMSSYIHTRPFNGPENVPPALRPCKKKTNNYPSPWYNPTLRQVTAEPINSPPVMRPMLLPYPFAYINHRNFSSNPASYYYSNYPWPQLDIYSRYKNDPQQFFGEYFTPTPNTAVETNVEELEQKYDEPINNDDEDMEIDNDHEKIILPDWQTEPLSAKVLEEVRANVLEKLKLPKPLSSKKNVKLEKVGKVIKLDGLIRAKRSANTSDSVSSDIVNKELYEPYIEKTICESSLELGLYRMGNMTELYPACCPQKITS